MTFSVKMPALGESVTEGTVTRWLKAEGDHINVDEPLLEVSTDKVDTEIPSPVSGTLSKILVQIDATVPVGADLAIIEDGAAAPAPVVAAPVAAPTPPPVAAPVSSAAMDVGSSSVAIETAEYCFDPQLSRGGVECDDTGTSAVGNDRRVFTDPPTGSPYRSMPVPMQRPPA